MYSVVQTAVLLGIDARMVSVEADISNGLPMFEWWDYWRQKYANRKKECEQHLKTVGMNYQLSGLP